jgi:hypothetical protein
VPFGSKLHLSKMKQPTSWKKKYLECEEQKWFVDDLGKMYLIQSPSCWTLHLEILNPPPSEAQHLSSRLRTKRSMRLKWLLASAWAIASVLQWQERDWNGTGTHGIHRISSMGCDQGSAQCIPSHPVGMWGPEDQPGFAPRGIPDQDLI